MNDSFFFAFFLHFLYYVQLLCVNLNKKKKCVFLKSYFHGNALA
jgi:hypothetical protein